MKRTSATLSVFTMLMGFGCAKTEEGSTTEVKSLSNLEEQAKGGARTQTQCKGSHAVNAGIEFGDGYVLGATNPALKDAVRQTMTALPSSVSFNFFQWGGTIQFRDDLGSVCKGAASLTQGADTGGCMIIKQGELTAYFKPDVNAVRYGLTRAFGYFVAVGTALADVKDGAVVFRQAEDQEIKAYWDSLKQTFLPELKARPGVDANGGALKDVEALDSFVFYQEAFDSKYCDGSLATQDSQRYPKTMALLNKEAESFARIDAAAERALKTRDTSALSNLGNTLQKGDHAYKHYEITRVTVEHYLSNNGAGLNLQTAKLPRQQGFPVFNLFRGGANIFRPGPPAGKI